MLTPAVKDAYRPKLQKNPQLPFDGEFIRTTNLQYELITRYGFDAIQLIFWDSNGEPFFELGKFPAECP
jgi:hypothetical protein